jgi:hypothetical protein
MRGESCNHCENLFLICPKGAEGGCGGGRGGWKVEGDVCVYLSGNYISVLHSEYILYSAMTFTDREIFFALNRHWVLLAQSPP